jgi:tetratricopeptide (TPR) repeat protein
MPPPPSPSCARSRKRSQLADEIQRAHPNDTMAINVTVPTIRAIAALRPANPAKADPAKAIDFLNAAALYARDNAGVFYARGIAYEQAGRYAEAQQDLQKILDIKSHTGPDIIFVVAQLEAGRLFQKAGRQTQSSYRLSKFSRRLERCRPRPPAAPRSQSGIREATVETRRPPASRELRSGYLALNH